MRALILAEQPASCAERLVERGFTADVAEEIAFYLDQAENLAAERDGILSALDGAGIDARIEDTARPDRWLPWLSQRPDETLVWSVTDGVRYFLGSGVAPIARVLGARCFGCGVQAQALAQDKAKSGAVAAALGVRVPPTGVVQDGEWLSRPPADAGPWFVKPATLGAKIGIWPDSRVESLADALDLARRIRDRYRDDAVVQPFLPGWDARVSYMAVEPDPRFERLGAYRLDTLGEGEAGGAFVTLEDSRSLVGQRPDGAVSATLLDMRTSEPAINAAIVSMARTLARGIGLQDVFSLDIRLGEDGTPWFLEFEVSPAVTIYDFKRYLSDHWEMDLSGAIVRAFTRLLARPQVL